MRWLTPISFAITAASVVLPRPGGPWSRSWSSGSAAHLGGLYEHAEVFLDLLLAYVFPERPRTQRDLPPSPPGNIVVEVIYLSSFSSES